MIEIRLIVLVIIIAAIYILSKTTCVRKWICISKGNILSEWTRVKIRMEQRWIKRCLFIFRVAIEMVVIWWIFVWRGGVIYNRIKDILIMCQGKIEGIINTVQTDPDIILQALVYISPFGRSCWQPPGRRTSPPHSLSASPSRPSDTQEMAHSRSSIPGGAYCGPCGGARRKTHRSPAAPARWDCGSRKSIWRPPETL